MIILFKPQMLILDFFFLYLAIKQHNMKTKSIINYCTKTCLLLFLTLIASCKTSSSKKSQTLIKKPKMIVSYQKDIRPVMVQKCTPCHFPERGRKEMLHTYQQTKEYAVAILKRIQLPVENRKFMPFKSKRAPLTKAEIKLFNDWTQYGMAK